MRCPQCFDDTREIAVRGMVMEICSVCKSLWADRFALAAALGLGDDTVQTLHLEASKLPPGEATCPGCGVSLDPMELDGHRVDVCGNCSCVWIGRRVFRRLYFERLAEHAQETVKNVGGALVDLIAGPEH